MEDFLILKKFCDEYREFGNAHMVDFIQGDFSTRLDFFEKRAFTV